MSTPGDSEAGPRRQDLAQHLRLFSELGVQGVSRDPVWRERASGPAESDSAEASAAGADSDSASVLLELRTFIRPDCTRCKLGTLGRRQVVFGVGNPRAELMC